MRRLCCAFPFVVMVLSMACSPYSDDLAVPMGRRAEQLRVLPSAYSDSAEVEPRIMYDTVLYVSGVRVCDDYDWHRDTLAGHFNAELVMFRDSVPVLMLAAGDVHEISPEPDTHHILGGRLYTEFSNRSQTVIRCNGEERLRFEGREYLLGLLEKDGRLHTLSRKRGGDGFVYRIDGEVVLSKSSGRVFGSFQDYSYPETGALYEDAGGVCFCFACSSSVMTVVRDGLETDIPALSGSLALHDVKCRDGFVCYVCRTNGGMHLVLGGERLTLENSWYAAESVRIHLDGGPAFLTGLLPDVEMSLAWTGDGRTEFFHGTAAMFLQDDSSYLAVSEWETGGIGILGVPDYSAFIAGNYLFISSQTAVYSGGVLSLLLNPADRTGTCSLWRAGEEMKYDGVDYLTGMEMLVSQSSSGRVLRPG